MTPTTNHKLMRKWKIALEFKIEYFWIGAYWRKLWWGKQLYIVDVLICLIPCVPIHFTYFGSKPDSDGKITIPIGVQSAALASPVSGDNYEAMLAERVLRLATVVETLIRKELEKEDQTRPRVGE